VRWEEGEEAWERAGLGSQKGRVEKGYGKGRSTRTRLVESARDLEGKRALRASERSGHARGLLRNTGQMIHCSIVSSL